MKNKIVADEVNQQVSNRSSSATSQVFKGLKRNEPEKVKIKKLDEGMNKLSHGICGRSVLFKRNKMVLAAVVRGS